jgi:hypothetical protein
LFGQFNLLRLREYSFVQPPRTADRTPAEDLVGDKMAVALGILGYGLQQGHDENNITPEEEATNPQTQTC